MEEKVHDFIAFCRLNKFCTNEYWSFTYTMNDMNILVGVFKLNIQETPTFLVFSCPSDNSKNIFFTIAENDFKIASLCLAYCEYYSYGVKNYIEEYIHFNDVFIEELKKIYRCIIIKYTTIYFSRKIP